MRSPSAHALSRGVRFFFCFLSCKANRLYMVKSIDLRRFGVYFCRLSSFFLGDFRSDETVKIDTKITPKTAH